MPDKKGGPNKSPPSSPYMGQLGGPLIKKGISKKYLVRASTWSRAEKRPVFRVFHIAGGTRHPKYALHGTRKSFPPMAKGPVNAIVVFDGRDK